MGKFIRRFRVRPSVLLYLSPEEAWTSGIHTGEELIEEVLLDPRPVVPPRMYAVIWGGSEDELSRVDVLERREALCETRREAAGLLAELGEPYMLAGVQNIITVDRRIAMDEWKAPEQVGDPSVDLKALHDFVMRQRTK
jgi:hypothetical protein